MYVYSVLNIILLKGMRASRAFIIVQSETRSPGEGGDKNPSKTHPPR